MLMYPKEYLSDEQINTETFLFEHAITELATWLVGSAIVVDGDDLAVSTHENTAIIHTDCLLNIIIENAQDNQDILLPTLQFVEVGFCNNYGKIFMKIIEFNFNFLSNKFRRCSIIQTSEFCIACYSDIWKHAGIMMQVLHQLFKHGRTKKMNVRNSDQLHRNQLNPLR